MSRLPSLLEVLDAAAAESAALGGARERPKPIVWDRPARDRVTAALCAMCRADGAQLQLVKSGCLGVLVAQIRHVHSRLRQQCALAVYQLTCTALRGTAAAAAPNSSPRASAAPADAAPPSPADAELYGLGRLKLLLDADVASALTVGSLFRADDNVTRDLCAATLFNLVALTRLADTPPEGDAQRAGGSAGAEAASAPAAAAAAEAGGGDGDDYAPPPATALVKARPPSPRSNEPSLGTQLRRKLLEEGTLWAVVKLAQGFAETAATTIAALGRPAFHAQREIDLAVAQDLHSRYVTTARFMRNMSIDPESADDAAKRHCLDTLLWYAQQAHAFYRVSIECEAGVPPLRLHAATVPAIVGWVGETLVSLSGHESVRTQLVSRGVIGVIAELVAVARVHLRVRTGASA